MSIIVTGGMGFIGSNIVRKLNELNYKDIYIIDTPKNGSEENLVGCTYKDIIEKDRCLQTIQNGKFCNIGDIDTIFHQGAITDTTHQDEDEMMEVNYSLSVGIFQHCMMHNIRMIYASSAAVYGMGENGFEADVDCENPLNIYGKSKLDFDNYFRRNYDFDSNVQIVGLRYFNVYGPGEEHKAGMASPICQFTKQAIEDKEIRVFEGSEKFLRDFIHIDDIVKINMHFMRKTDSVGIYNCGTGEANSFLTAAKIVSEETEIPIKTIPFPENLKDKYQSFTQADVTTLRKVGYASAFRDFSVAAKEYTSSLLGK